MSSQQKSSEIQAPRSSNRSELGASESWIEESANGATATAASLAAGGASEAGAQPSITAPANYIRPLRHGVDSLYLSFTGGIDPHVAVMLQELKTAAQASDERVQCDATYYNGEHCFTVSPRGRGRFAFVLEDNWFRLELSNASACCPWPTSKCVVST